MTSITDLAKQLREITAWQRTPAELTMSEYENMILYGVKTMIIDTGRSSSFSWNMLSRDEDTFELVVDLDLPLDEEKYVLLTAQIQFFKKVQSDVNNIVGYTTDALSVTNADKPYAHLQDTIEGLERERRITYYKMTRFTLGTN